FNFPVHADYLRSLIIIIFRVVVINYITAVITTGTETHISQSSSDRVSTAESQVDKEKVQNAVLERWKAPKEITDKFPYYVSGFDFDGRPVFIMEIGKWPIRYIVEKGGQDVKNLDSLTQLVHAPTLQYILRHFASFQRIQDSFAYGYYVNVNAVASQFITMAKPLLGSALERVEISGTQKSSWIPKLLRTISADQLPPWYGGAATDQFKPVAAYG
ncbi:unnamed protein product, partial [Allacma fusca]